MTNKRIKLNIIIISIVMALVCGLSYCLTSYFQAKNVSTQALERTVDVERNKIDHQSILDSFDNGKLETIGTLTTFEGTKPISLADFEMLDNLSASDIEACEKISVAYHFSYDAETNLVTLSAETKSGEEIIEVEEIQGVAFYNEAGEIDAVLNVEGEAILLSELQDLGMIQNCGWFSNLFKKIVKVVAVVAAVVAVAAVVVATVGVTAPAVVAAGVGAVAGATTLTSTCLTVAMVAAGISLASTAVASIKFEGVTYKLEQFDKVKKQLVYGRFYLAVGDKDGRMLVSPIAVSNRSTAALAMKSGLSIYTSNAVDAFMIAQMAGNGKSPVLDPAHRTGYFAHYHAYGRPKPSSHAFYGTPKTQGCY